MKKCSFLFILVLIIGVSQGVWAENFEWYTPKDKITGGIYLRNGPSLDSEVVELMCLPYFYVVPLLKVVGKEPNGMYKVLSNRNGTPRGVEYEYFYFWVAGWLLRKVDLEKENLALLVPAEYEYSNGINVYSKPHIFNEEGWGDIPNRWQYAYVSVKMTGKHIGPFVEITQLHGYGEGKREFTLSEFFGFKNNSPFIKYPATKRLYTRSTYLDGSRYRGIIIVRKKPSLLSTKAGYYVFGNLPVKVIGEQGYFYKTINHEWIFKQCLAEERGK